MNIALPVALSLLIAVQFVAAQELTREWKPEWKPECKLEGIDTYVVSMDISSDDKLLVLGCRAGTIKLFDVVSHEQIKTQTLSGEEIYQVSFSPDGESIAAATSSGKLILWDCRLSKENFRLSRPNIMCFCFDSNSRRMLIGRWGASLDVYDVERKARVKTVREDVTTRSVAWSPDGKLIACGNWGDYVQVFDSKSYKEVLQLRRHRKYFPPVAFSPDSGILAIGGTGDDEVPGNGERGSESEVLLWNLKEGKEHKRLKVQARGGIGEGDSQVTQLAYCPNGKLLAASHFDQTRVWNVETETVVFVFPERLNPEGSREQSMAFSHNGKFVVLSVDKEVGLWRLP